MTPFLPKELTPSYERQSVTNTFKVERKFVQVKAGEAIERSERLRALLLRGATILASSHKEMSHV